MNEVRPYVRAVVFTSTPAFLVAAVFGMTAVAAMSVVLMTAAAVLVPKPTAVAFKDSLAGLGTVGVLALTIGLGGAGLWVFARSTSEGVILLMPLGGVLVVAGCHLTRASFSGLVLRPAPPPAVVRPRPVVIPETRTLVVQSPKPPAPVARPVGPAPLELEKPKPRETVFWGGRVFPAAVTDERFYVFSGPPGRGKSKLVQLFLIPILKEILDPRSDSRLIVFEPKREMYAWIATQWPDNSLVPLRLFCPSDVRSCCIDWDYDYRTLGDAEMLAHAMFPENPKESQPFFPESLRTLVATAYYAIRRKLRGHGNGRVTFRLLVLALSRSEYLKKLVGSDVQTRFADELLSIKAEETAQNIKMSIVSKLLKFRILAAHMARVSRENALSLERFLQSNGVLCISRDEKYKVQHDGVNSIIMERIGQILASLQADPARQRRTYIVLDEFPTLAGDKPCPGILDMFLRLRSLGVVFVITFQSYATLKRVYGETADEIINTCQNFVILGSGDPTDAKHAAERVGKTRGYEAQENRSTSDGTSTNRTKGESDTKGGGFSETRLAGAFKAGYRPPGAFFSPIPGGFTATDTASTNWSHTESSSTTEAETKTRTEGFTWVWFDREIKSPTELMRLPLPTVENGIHFVAYRAGEQAPWESCIGWDEINKYVHRTNRFIPEHWKRDEHEEELEEATPEELLALDLVGVKGEGTGLLGLAGESGKKAIERADENTGQDDGDWDKAGRSNDEGGGDPWSDFLNDQ